MSAGGELQGPVGYSITWAVLAAAAVLVVVAYYAAVLWWTRAPRPRRPERSARARRRHLRELDAIAGRVRSGEVPASAGHQQVSATVRGFVASVSDLPATSMTLDSLRAEAPASLTDLVERLYPPAFAGDEQAAAEGFEDAVASARVVVASWS